MNVEDMVSLVRLRTGQYTASGGASAVDRWTDDNITRLFNIGQSTFSARGGVFEFDDTTSLSMSADDPEVSVPGTWLAIRQLWHDTGTDEHELTYRKPDKWDFGNTSDSAGDPKNYTIFARNLYLDPPPDATEAAKQLRAMGYGLPSDLTIPMSTGESPGLPAAFHGNLIDYAVGIILLAETKGQAGVNELQMFFEGSKLYSATYGAVNLKDYQDTELKPFLPLQSVNPDFEQGMGGFPLSTTR